MQTEEQAQPAKASEKASQADPGKYSQLTDEEFAKLAELSAKALGSTSPNASQDGRGFQVESTTAIEGEVVESDAEAHKTNQTDSCNEGR